MASLKLFFILVSLYLKGVNSAYISNEEGETVDFTFSGFYANLTYPNDISELNYVEGNYLSTRIVRFNGSFYCDTTILSEANNVTGSCYVANCENDTVLEICNSGKEVHFTDMGGTTWSADTFTENLYWYCGGDGNKPNMTTAAAMNSDIDSYYVYGNWTIDTADSTVAEYTCNYTHFQEAGDIEKGDVYTASADSSDSSSDSSRIIKPSCFIIFLLSLGLFLV
ncbi:hypothetical protein POMI540_0446 [Schizosaccharomyces pombe]